MKKCTNCNQTKPYSSYEIHKGCKDGYRNQCNKCRNKKKKRKWNATLYKRMKQRHKDSSHITCSDSLTQSYLIELAEKQNGKCYWLNIDIDFTLSDKLRSPSVDRLDNNKGYTQDNIVLTTRFANLGRCNSTQEEFKQFVDSYIN